MTTTTMILVNEELRAILRQAGAAPDDAVELAETALALAAIDRPRVPLGWYRGHLAQLVREVRDEATGPGNRDRGVEGAAAALHGVIAGRHGYQGDTVTYEDMQNANLMRVIDRRKGLPVALGIIYIHVARAQGWGMAGLNFPGHFLVRLEIGGQRAILDPFHAGMARKPSELRDLLKAIAGNDAELRPEHYAPVNDRDILLRLQNNIKLRHLRSQRVDHAIEVVNAMLMIAPGDPMLWREAGLMHAQLGNLNTAVEALERYLACGTSDVLRHETAVLVQRLKARLN